jgi:hypothetical protein
MQSEKHQPTGIVTLMIFFSAYSGFNHFIILINNFIVVYWFFRQRLGQLKAGYEIGLCKIFEQGKNLQLFSTTNVFLYFFKERIII